MYTIKGQIKHIKEVKTEHTHKYLATVLQQDGKDCYVEFRGKVMMQVFEPYKVDDCVSINAILDGKTSSQNGMQYNNIVARNIKPL